MSSDIALTKSATRRRTSFWFVSATEARIGLAVLAAGLWSATLLVSLNAPIPCGDFVCPYTMGALVRDATRLYNVDAFHAAQVALVPESASLFYPPVYPPQLALLMAPFSLLPFGVAAAAWSILTVVLYAAVARGAFRALHSRLNASVVILAAIAFPPFVNVVGYGQNTVLLVGACFLAWRALARQQPFLAGAALGLLAIKPQFGLPFAVIVIAGREWRLLAGAVCSVLVQAAAVWLVMGPAAFTGFLAIVSYIIRNTDALAPVTQYTHSIRTLTRLLPDPIGQPVWIAMIGLVLSSVAAVWRSSAPLHVRLGIAVLAAVLASPHLIAYDAALLALPLLWFGDWLETRGSAGSYWLAVTLLFVTLAFSWAKVLRVQPSVIVMLWIGYHVWRATRQGERLAIDGVDKGAAATAK